MSMAEKLLADLSVTGADGLIGVDGGKNYHSARLIAAISLSPFCKFYLKFS